MMGAMSQIPRLPPAIPRQADCGAMTITGVQIPSMYECADGYVMISVAFGPVFGQMTKRLAKWAADEDHLARNIAEITGRRSHRSPTEESNARRSGCAGRGPQVARSQQDQDRIRRAARELGLLASAVINMKDVAESAQYRERGLFNPMAIAAGP